MKLIDLDAKEPYLLDGRYSVGIPDNAPTVHHPNCDICEDKGKQYLLGFQDRYLTGKERPQGEWQPISEGNRLIYEGNRLIGRGNRHECNQCKEYAPSFKDGSEHLSKFCPNCGAKMSNSKTTGGKEE